MLTIINKWSQYNAVILLVITILTFIINDLTPLVIGASLSFFLLFFWNRQYIGRYLGGIANIVTLSRLLGVFGLLLFYDHLSHFVIGSIALLIVCADVLDGYLAKRFNIASIFGEYFDKETDAFYVLAIAALLIHLKLVGFWVISVGLLRYIYVIALIYFKPIEQKEKRSKIGKFIAGVLMIGLFACFFLPITYYMPIIIGATVLVFYSFLNSFAKLRIENTIDDRYADG